MIDELLPCRVCHEDTAYMEEENGWTVYVMCACCGSHTAFCPFGDGNDTREEAEKKATYLWNMGKVIAEARGE